MIFAVMTLHCIIDKVGTRIVERSAELKESCSKESNLVI